MPFPCALVAALLLQAPAAAPAQDLRAHYDVQAYRLDLRVDPAEERLSGVAGIEGRVVEAALGEVHLDLVSQWTVQSVELLAGALEPGGSLRGRALEFRHDSDRLVCVLPQALARGGSFALAVAYAGKPKAADSFEGFHWDKTPSGAPWVSTSCQGLGAHSWWPCKASFFHPEDKHERLFVNLTVPAGLYGVANGRLTARSTAEPGWETFHWRHEYPCETYAVAIAVAPYVVVEDELALEGIEGPVPFIYYVLPEHEERARIQFAEVPRLLEVYGEAFGPFPFPASKFGLVETSFWGMEHSTAIAYGSTFPAWCRATGAPDRYAARNRYFDYILVHEVAHEWWGNAVSAADWGDFWLHEGFATYAEGVFVEATQGRERAEAYFQDLRRAVPRRGRLYRGKGVSSRAAYSGILYSKGGWVLNTLRTCVDDDALWWRSLRAFNLAHRFGNATTEDFRAVLERETGRPWKTFFDEWVYGSGYPVVTGTLRASADSIEVALEAEGTDGGGFHLPLEIAWTEDGEPRRKRVEIAPGTNELSIPCAAKPAAVEAANTRRLLGRFEIRVE
jgi:aminopeptidase N